MKKNQTGLLQMKAMITERQNLISGLNRRYEGQIIKLER